MDYARALVEHPKWLTYPEGMGVSWYQDAMIGWLPATVVDATLASVRIAYDGKLFTLSGNDADLRPAINHPATKGWLLHMLREHVPLMEVRQGRLVDAWMVTDGDRLTFTAATEGEALAAALLAVWGDA